MCMQSLLLSRHLFYRDTYAFFAYEYAWLPCLENFGYTFCNHILCRYDTIAGAALDTLVV